MLGRPRPPSPGCFTPLRAGPCPRPCPTRASSTAPGGFPSLPQGGPTERGHALVHTGLLRLQWLRAQHTLPGASARPPEERRPQPGDWRSLQGATSFHCITWSSMRSPHSQSFYRLNYFLKKSSKTSFHTILFEKSTLELNLKNVVQKQTLTSNK